MASNVLEEHDLNFVEGIVHQVPEEQVVYSEWVKAAFTPKAKFKKRIIVIGKYRIWFIGKGTIGRKRVEKEYHLYELVSVAVENGAMELAFHNGSSKCAVTSSSLPEIIRHIRRGHTRLTVGTSLSSLAISIPDIYLLPIEPLDLPLVGGYEESYKAQCSIAKKKANVEYLLFIHDIAERNIVELDLSRFPAALDSKTEHFDLNTAIGALAHNSYFRSLVLKEMVLPKNGLAVSLMAKFNRSLTKLVLNKLDSSFDWYGLGESLRSNSYHQIQYLDLSSNEISPRAAISISHALACFTHPLSVLNLSKCGLTGKSLVPILEALDNLVILMTLEELDLSNNSFDDTSSVTLGTWITKHKNGGKLRVLRLENSCVRVASIAMNLGHVQGLQVLDISGSILDRSAVSLLNGFIEQSKSLYSFNISYCQGSHDIIMDLITTYSTSGKYKTIELYVAHLPVLVLKHYSLILGECCLSILDISDTGLKESWMALVLEFLRRYKSLIELRIGGNTMPANVGELLRELTERTALRKLSVRGNQSYRIREGLLPIFTFLESNNTIEEFDFDGNSTRDSGASAFAKVLRVNQTLKSVCLDNNKISLAGFAAIRRALQDNYTLDFLPFPMNDFNRAYLSLSTTVSKAELYKVWFDIQYLIRNNRDNKTGRVRTSSYGPVPAPVILLQSEPMPNPNPYAMAVSLYGQERSHSPEEVTGQPQPQQERLYPLLNEGPSIYAVEQAETNLAISGSTAAKIKQEYIARNDQELSAQMGDPVEILQLYSEDSPWIRAKIRGKIGFLPVSCIEFH